MSEVELVERKNRKGTVYFENGAGEIVAKTCRKCSEVKELKDFSQDKRRLGWRMSECRRCKAKYREENKEQLAKWREQNKEKTPEYNAKYREENKEQLAKYAAKYYEENKEQRAKYNAKWREENPDKMAKCYARWAKENPDKKAIYDQRRRARKAAMIDTITDEQYAETSAYFENACVLTGETTDLHREHAIPLSIGHGGSIRENMYPMAARLNLSKGDRNIFEWFEANRQRFELSQARFDKLIAWLASANAMTVEEYRKYVYWCHANPRKVGEAA